MPSLHATELNPYIDLEHSPFFVQQATMPWNRPELLQHNKRVTYPRRAGISSFGASGANVHILLEEYNYPEEVAAHQQNNTNNNLTYIIPFSAKNKERLVDMVRNMLRLLGSPSGPLPTLLDMAYTLQTGRVALEERVAFVVNSIPALIESLRGYLDNKQLDNCFWGNSKNATAKEQLAGKNNTVAHSGIHSAIDFASLAVEWVQGGEVNWAALYTTPGQFDPGKPRRISLPTYPLPVNRIGYPVQG